MRELLLLGTICWPSIYEMGSVVVFYDGEVCSSDTLTTTQMFRSILLVVMVGASLVAATDGDVESELQLLGTLATKLQLAATYGDLEGLRILLAAGAPVDETVDLNVTPLHLAARKGHTRWSRL